MRCILALLVLTSVAHAEPLDLAKTLARVKDCGGDPLAKLGTVEKAETIGKRPAASVVHLVGTKARGYAVFRDGMGCEVIAVAGKPLAFAKGNFGGGATAAYGLSGPNCSDGICPFVVSLKSADDKLLDLLVLDDACENGMSLQKRAVFAGRDSLELGCYGSGGADVGRADYILDAGSGSLQIMLTVNAGIGWVQAFEDNKPRCTAAIPGGLKVVSVGAKPEIDVTTLTEPEEAEAAGLQHMSGGCDITVATRRYVLDAKGKAFVAKPGKPRVKVRRKTCTCEKP